MQLNVKFFEIRCINFLNKLTLTTKCLLLTDTDIFQKLSNHVEYFHLISVEEIENRIVESPSELCPHKSYQWLLLL